MGGEDGGNAYLNNVHILDRETMAWQEVKTTGAELMPRAGWLLLLLTLLPFLTICLPFFCEEMLREKYPSEPKLSMRKELKRRWKEYRAMPFMLDKQRDADKSLVSSHREFQAHVQPLGEKMFKARVSDVYYRYTLEASIDGKLFRGLLFSYKPGFAQEVQSYMARKTSQEETTGRPKGCKQLLDDAYYAMKKLGEKRSCGSYNLWSLLGNGSMVALGSNWPVVAVNPVGGIHTAVERTPSGWSYPWIPKERISAWDAVAGYSSSAVYAAALKDLVGSLTQGKFANFVTINGWAIFK
ncbi:hypothetical protein SELMODRAFT_423336 [Selaginella moellendorffii]|uniref:Uncharacterized protein n=1 Tax=Selaginella moellendorffii TaxID=88036 RepID=D8SLC3_SELML|nr:hypothetical protein SELMODRAFT_423336 [Selaginella moellendorffii]